MGHWVAWAVLVGGYGALYWEAATGGIVWLLWAPGALAATKMTELEMRLAAKLAGPPANVTHVTGE